MDKSWKRSELEGSLLLRGVDLESVAGILATCPVRELQPGETLIHGGQPNRHMYVLLSGNLRVHLKPSMDPLTMIRPGEVVGELSVIDGQAASAYVIAHDQCRLLCLDERTLWSLVESSQPVARNLLFILSSRLRHGNDLVLTNQQLQREYERFAVIDAVTGLYNRHWLDSMLPRQVETCRKGGWKLCLLLLDIDGLKAYNDTYGHLAGDRVLHSVAQVMRSSMRSGQMIARYGGDEFVALLPGADEETARKVGERILENVKKAAVYDLDQSLLPSVTVSIGVAELRPEDSLESLITTADEALYAAKRAGRNTVLTSTSASQSDAEHP